MVEHVFAALADQTRRHVYGELAAHGPLTATALASDLAVSRQAVAKHLNVLAEAGMATSSKVGRETRYEAIVEPLSEVQQWIGSIENHWQLRLDALATSLQATSRQE